jgi:hypothetical protein
MLPDVTSLANDRSALSSDDAGATIMTAIFRIVTTA